MLKKISVMAAFFLSSLLFISCSSLEQPEVVASTNHYYIKHVNVVDVINKKVQNNVHVEVKGGVIVAVAPGTALHEKTNVTTIDGSGKYLIPGLWDNHSTVIAFSKNIDFPLYIANGVTSLRSNLSCPNEDEVSFYACTKDKAEWKKAVADEKIVGPTIQGWGSFPVNGKPTGHPDLPMFHGGHTVENAFKIVDHYAKYPANERPFFIKTYNWLPKESYLTLSDYAQEKGFEITGHLPRAMTIEEAIAAGQRSIAHARLFVYNCSKAADQFRSRPKRKMPLTELYPILIKNFDEESCQETYQTMAQSDIFINPTLMTRRNDYYGAAGMLDKMQGLEYAHYLFLSEWGEDIAKYGENLSEADIKAFKDFYELTAKTIADAQKAGVKILAGSDSWSEYNVPGFSLHEELQALSEAGIDNFSILQAATINGAEYFRVDDKVGSIDIGKQADMVLLEANPVEDIKNAQKIATVFKGNQIYNQHQLIKFKAGVKSLAGSHLFSAKLIMQVLQNPMGY